MLNINGELWHIYLVHPTFSALFRPDGSLTIGSCDDAEKAIYINDRLDDYMMRKVLCHELTHAAMFSYNIYLNPYEEEILADIIATYGEEIVYITNKVFSRIKQNRGVL